MRGRGGKAVVAVAGAAVCVMAGSVASNASTLTPVTKTFVFTGAEQTFTVPAGVASLHVLATGGKGAPGQQAPVAGGAATVSSNLSVKPGKKLYVEVGGDGVNGAKVTGAFNGGGLVRTTTAGGGGGASDLQSCSSSDPDCFFGDAALIVAAGSGGGGANAANGSGGTGGSQSAKGSDADPVARTNAATGGNPGGIGVGGTGGNVASTTDGACVYSAGGDQPGGTSFGLLGGTGGAPEMDNDGTLHGGGGGGGGGGYFGGGGGGGGTQVICNDGGSLTFLATGGAGGGGGASYVKGLDAQQIASMTTTDNTGVARIAITYTPAGRANLGVKISGPKTLKNGAKGTFEVKATNAGPDDDRNVAIDTEVPRGLRVTHVKLAGGSCFPGSLQCTVDKLKAGRSATVKVTAKATKPGKQKLQAKVSGDAIDSAKGNDKASFTTTVKKPRR